MELFILKLSKKVSEEDHRKIFASTLDQVSLSPSYRQLFQNGEVNGNVDSLNREQEKGEARDEKSKVPKHDDPEEEGISAAECGRRCWRQYLGRDDSLVTDLFLGQFRKGLFSYY